MFGTNEITGRKFFKENPCHITDTSGKLLVTKVFYTIQGEGPFTGQPAVFVRLAKCNLACHFCDADFDEGEWYSTEQLIDKCREEVAKHFKGDVPGWALISPTGFISLPTGVGLVITGGEPGLQKDVLRHFTRSARELFKWVQIETNGILDLETAHGTYLVCSPKCAEIHGKSSHFIKPHDRILYQASCLKFVMCDPTVVDGLYEAYSRIPDFAFEWKETHPARHIYISPMCIYKNYTKGKLANGWDQTMMDYEINELNHQYTAKYCMDHGCIFNMQTHLWAGLP